MCLGCDPGMFGDPTESGQCLHCTLGLFQNLKGSTQCQTCTSPETPNDERTGCELPRWGICNSDEYLHDDPPNDNTNWECRSCPKGANCAAVNSRWSSLSNQPGYSQMSYDNFTFGKCLNAKACNNNGTLKCTHGHDGELCSQCIPGWAATSRTEPCERCDESGLGLVAFVFAILIALLVFSFLVWDNLDGARMMIPNEGDDEATSTSMPFHSIAIRIVHSIAN